MRRALAGRFDGPRHVLRFGVGGMLLAAALFAAAWILYPPENDYHVLRKSASYLGSFDAGRNPVGWWLFSLGLLVLGGVTMGASLFRHRHLARVMRVPWPLRLSSGAFVLGGVLFALLGLVPDARQPFAGSFTFNDVHDRLAVLIFWCLGVGMATDGLVLWGDLRAHGHTHLDHRLLQRPYLTFGAIGLVAGVSLLTWHIRCRLDTSLKEWPGEGIYSLPMWEWILTFLGPATLVWVAWALATAPPRPPRT